MYTGSPNPRPNTAAVASSPTRAGTGAIRRNATADPCSTATMCAAGAYPVRHHRPGDLRGQRPGGTNSNPGQEEIHDQRPRRKRSQSRTPSSFGHPPSVEPRPLLASLSGSPVPTRLAGRAPGLPEGMTAMQRVYWRRQSGLCRHLSLAYWSKRRSITAMMAGTDVVWLKE